MSKSREELIMDTLPDNVELGITDLASDVAESSARAESAERRKRNRRKLAEPEQDMAPEVPPVPTATPVPQQAKPLDKVECERLLRSFGVQTSVQLSKNDTYNLLASLLSCTERQIDMMLKSPQMPLAIKIVLKRLKEDCETGEMVTVNQLWDRLFGKGPLRDDLPNTGLVESAVFPNHPMSREAYALIIKKWQ